MAQTHVGQHNQTHAGTAEQASNISKSVIVRHEIDVLKTGIEEILTRATTLFHRNIPNDNIEEPCEYAQDTLDLMRHGPQKYSDAFHEFQAIADTVAEDDVLLQKNHGAMGKQLDDA